MQDIIIKKQQGLELTKEELSNIFNGYIENTVTDEVMTLLLKAICSKGMTDQEIYDLTDIFIKSGDIIDLSQIEGIKVDKHSTGGVGDKTTLIIGPIVAACNVKFAKMSGRGLGHTGGTIDKLESVAGFKTTLTEEEFINQVKELNISLVSQTANLVPMDKKVYALRDVTNTVASIPLIAVSIMSKKIASGADKILIDIKLGKGAFLKTKEEAEKLSNLMIAIGKDFNREVRTIITDMDNPLGKAIGNSLEVMEAIQVLKNETTDYLRDLCIELSTNLVSMGKNIDYSSAKEEVIQSLLTGKAYNKFLEFINAQGGNINSLEISPNYVEIIAEKEGIVKSIDALKLGLLAVELGAGRKEKNQPINHQVGIVLEKQVDDIVTIGDSLLKIYYDKKPPVINSNDYIIIE